MGVGVEERAVRAMMKKEKIIMRLKRRTPSLVSPPSLLLVNFKISNVLGACRVYKALISPTSQRLCWPHS